MTLSVKGADAAHHQVDNIVSDIQRVNLLKVEGPCAPASIKCNELFMFETSQEHVDKERVPARLVMYERGQGGNIIGTASQRVSDQRARAGCPSTSSALTRASQDVICIGE